MSPTVSFGAPVSVVVSVVACSTTEIVVAPVCAERAFPEPDAQALTATTRTRIPPSGRTMLRTRFMTFLLGWMDVRAYSTRQARVKGTPCWHGFRRDPVGPLSRLLRHHRGVADAIDETCDMRIAVVSAQHLERAATEAEVRRLASPTSLEGLLQRYPKRPGTRKIRELLDYNVERVVEGCEVDFDWASARLVVELDGYATHADPQRLRGGPRPRPRPPARRLPRAAHHRPPADREHERGRRPASKYPDREPMISTNQFK